MSEAKVDAQAPGVWTVVLASSAGTIIEWYDFYLYGSLAVFFSTLFYPANDPTAAVLISVATFATGFVIRPFGAIVFGSLGDRLGRKHTFLLTLILMSEVWQDLKPGGGWQSLMASIVVGCVFGFGCIQSMATAKLREDYFKDEPVICRPAKTPIT